MTEMRVCLECGHKHSTDLIWPTASPCPDHKWTDACPYDGTACPPAEERERVTAELSRLHLRPDLTPEQLQEFKDRFEAAVKDPWRIQVLGAWDEPFSVESRRERRRRLGLKWWQRGAR